MIISRSRGVYPRLYLAITPEKGEIVNFSDREDRMEIRIAVTSMGADFASYNQDGGFTLAMPRDFQAQQAIRFYLSCQGIDQGEKALFPLCSDKPPLHQRHHGPYNPPADDPGYWSFEKFHCKDPETLRAEKGVQHGQR